MPDLRELIGFDWDQGNQFKNEKHGVSQAEVEQVFFNRPILLLDDALHSSTQENRYHAFGATDQRRLLHVTFPCAMTGLCFAPSLQGR